MRGYRTDIAFDGVESASAPAPDGCPVTHLPGTALLPGLIDTHVHLCADSSPNALDLVPDRSRAELQAVVAASLQQHLRAGVTAVRDLGDHRWIVVDLGQPDDAPTVVPAGPPITTPKGHCWSMGGEVAGTGDLRRAVRERADRGAAVVKIMASGGGMTAGTDVQDSLFDVEELRVVVEEAHALGLPVTAHAPDQRRRRRDLAGQAARPAPRGGRPDGRVRPPTRGRARLGHVGGRPRVRPRAADRAPRRGARRRPAPGRRRPRWPIPPASGGRGS